MINLEWGLRDVIPDNATGAIGLRMIVTQDGTADTVPGRSDIHGDINPIQQVISLVTLREVIRSKLRSYEINTRENKVHTLFSDDGVTFLANTNASAGYLYVTGWCV